MKSGALQEPAALEAFPALLDGKEPLQCRQARADAFSRVWQNKEEQLEVGNLLAALLA